MRELTSPMLMSLLGFVLVIAPELADGGFIVTHKGILQTVGGVLIGAGVASFSSHLSLSKTNQTLFRTLKQNSDALLIDEAKDIVLYKKTWYFYYMTSMGGVRFWRLLKIDLRHGLGSIRLVQRIGLKNRAGNYEYYEVEAISRFGKFILYFYPEERTIEPTMNAVFHAIYEPPHAGIMQLMTWDRVQLISPCILSDAPVENWRTSNDPVPDNVAERLNAIWVEEIRADNGLPDVSAYPGFSPSPLSEAAVTKTKES